MSSNMGRRADPLRSCRYLVEIEGVIAGGFSEVSGLEMELEAEPLREGGRNDMVHTLPVGTKYGTLILTRGVTDSDVLWRWQSDIRNGQIIRRTIRIVLQDESGQEVWDWRCLEALPTKWTGPGFNAGQGEVAVERLELVHNGIRSG